VSRRATAGGRLSRALRGELRRPDGRPRPLSERDPLPFDYIAWLATAAPATLRDQGAPPGGTTALLYLMLRHALLTEYDRCSRRVLDVGGVLHVTEAREAELVGILPPPAPGQPAPVTRTAWERFDLNVTGVTGALTVGQFLADPPGGPGTPADVRAALAELADLKAALTRSPGCRPRSCTACSPRPRGDQLRHRLGDLAGHPPAGRRPRGGPRRRVAGRLRLGREPAARPAGRSGRRHPARRLDRLGLPR
jgi:hypothetical protein